MSAARPLVIRALGLRDYVETWRAMQHFSQTRLPETADELWLLQHPPVYTLGRNADAPDAIDGIPVIATDRGGHMTYHGPGQLIAYALLDLARARFGAKALVAGLEQAVINLLGDFGITAARRPGAPGVYVDDQKIAALGLRIRAGRSYHGLSLNVDMDLAPFARIDPCGYPGLQVTQLADLGVGVALDTVAEALSAHLLRQLGYNRALYEDPQYERHAE